MLRNGSLFAHCIEAASAFARFELQAQIDIASLVLDVRSPKAAWRLTPRFRDPGGNRWRFDSTPDVLASAQFAGWLPYVRRDPGPLEDPQETLRLAEKVGIRTVDAASGQGRMLADGDVGRAWFFEGTLYAIERHRKPWIEGDGLLSVRELVQRKAFRPLSEEDWDCVTRVLGASGRGDLSSVPLPGDRLQVDHRYDSPLHQRTFTDQNAMARLAGWGGGQSLWRLGHALANAVPARERRHFVFACDFMVEPGRDDPVLIGLELEPLLAPNLYAVLAERLFRSSDKPPDWRGPTTSAALSVNFSRPHWNAPN
ncbi:MAG: hypothetical protein M9951_10270 [Burkholderiaceae bacterium]|nr:hypothetical protein [Burkholderiaceae bacterium]